MTHDEARAAIESLFAAQWSATPIAFQNVGFAPPVDGSPWVRLAIENGGATQASFGGVPRRFRITGSIRTEIHVEAGTGSATAFQLADGIGTLIAGADVAGLTFGAAGTMPGGEDGPDFELLVTVPFWHDDFR